MSRLANAWRRTWFGGDARLSIEVARVAIAVAGLCAWAVAAMPSYEAFLARYPEGAYEPVGLLRLLGGTPPPAWLLEATRIAGLVALIGMLVGFATRVSMVVSALALLVLAGVVESFTDGWSHSFVPVLLVHLAFVAAPAGRALSVDAWLRRRRGRPDANGPAPVWPVLLALVAVALPFFNAVYWKLRMSGVAWALSDNLRHQILTRFDWAGDERTALADFLVRHQAAWKAAAAANMVTQLLPMLACLFMRRPLVRATLGIFYVVEVVLLDLVMGLPNYSWLPFAALFVDWDRLAAWWRRRRGGVVAPESEAAPPAPRATSWFIAAFLLANLAIAFVWRGLDRHLNLYPLVQYRMFAMTRAKQPYDTHQSWEFDGLRFRAGSKTVDRAAVEAQLDKRYRKRRNVRDARAIERLLREATRVKRVAGNRLEVWLVILVAPPYPAEATLVSHDIGLLGSCARARSSRCSAWPASTATDAPSSSRARSGSSYRPT